MAERTVGVMRVERAYPCQYCETAVILDEEAQRMLRELPGAWVACSVCMPVVDALQALRGYRAENHGTYLAWCPDPNVP